MPCPVKLGDSAGLAEEDVTVDVGLGGTKGEGCAARVPPEAWFGPLKLADCDGREVAGAILNWSLMDSTEMGGHFVGGDVLAGPRFLTKRPWSLSLKS